MTPVTRTILVADDEEPIRTALRRLFTRRGWDVVEAADGSEALGLLLGQSGERFLVILSDLRMPGMSGAKLYERLAEARPELAQRIIFSSGDAFTDEARDLANRTGRAVLEKPFDLANLVSMAEQMAERIVGPT
jgi:two-component system NtrC family sensor kinase